MSKELKCWSCKAVFTLSEHAECDGCCWKCGVEIDLNEMDIAAAPQPPALGKEPEVIAEVVNKYGDPEAFAVRDMLRRTDIDKLKIGTELIERAHLAPLQAEIENLKLECDAWKNTAESFEDFYRKTEVELDQLKAQCDELEALLREVAALDPRGEFMGWQLDGRIDAALSKPAGSECCTPTTEEKALLAAGDCTPEELWGGSKPTCPKCIGRAGGATE